MAAIAQVVQGLPAFTDPNLLVGADGFSDAGVYRIAPGIALVQTLDFFPPIVDEPYLYGRIAAANSLSDVYAMGGRPLTAMNIVGFPDNELSLTILSEILRGGAERVQAAGAVLVGGHSVRDAEIKFGLSVTGVVDPSRMMTNRAAKVGDVLALTKALGTGFVATANRAGRCPGPVMDEAIESMVALNDIASRAAVELGARAATDITGFGLAGHATEMAKSSGVSICLDLRRLPLLPGSEQVAGSTNYSRANKQTREHLLSSITMPTGLDPMRLDYLFDPQTSGGLLVAIAADKAPSFVARCQAEGALATAIVGEVVPRSGTPLVVEP